MLITWFLVTMTNIGSFSKIGDYAWHNFLSGYRELLLIIWKFDFKKSLNLCYCLFELMLYVIVNLFPVTPGRFLRLDQYQAVIAVGTKCLAQGHTTVPPRTFRPLHNCAPRVLLVTRFVPAHGVWIYGEPVHHTFYYSYIQSIEDPVSSKRNKMAC